MRFYTKKFLTRIRAEGEWEAMGPMIAAKWREIEPHATQGLLALISSDSFGGFHDAVLMSVMEGETLNLEFCTGDLQRGHFAVKLEFHNAEVATRGRSLRRVVRGPFTELLYTEVDWDAGRFEWRGIYSDYTVVSVTFSDVDVTFAPREGRYWGRRGPSKWRKLVRRVKRPFVRSYWWIREKWESPP